MNDQLETIAKKVRRTMIGALVPKESHHIGCSLSITDILVFLYSEQLRVYSQFPKHPERDIFILSKGHGTLALYTTLYERGFFTLDFLMTYDTNGGCLPEHASTTVPGVELSTGSLGHGLPVGLGFATAFKDDNKTNKVYVLMSDGEFDEGSNWEAIMYAGQHQLKNVIVVVDVNGLQGYAPTCKVIDLSPLADKVEAFRWETYQVNGHDFNDLTKVFSMVNQSQSNKPKMIFARTTKGKGVPYFEGRFDSHYKSIDEKTKKKILEKFMSY